MQTVILSLFSWSCHNIFGQFVSAQTASLFLPIQLESFLIACVSNILCCCNTPWYTFCQQDVCGTILWSGILTTYFTTFVYRREVLMLFSTLYNNIWWLVFHIILISKLTCFIKFLKISMYSFPSPESCHPLWVFTFGNTAKCQFDFLQGLWPINQIQLRASYILCNWHASGPIFSHVLHIHFFP